MNRELRINRAITANTVRIVPFSGGGQGEICSLSEALAKAKEERLDLVEIAPTADPPVCRILDYGRYKFQQDKRTKEQKKNQKLTRLKEVRMQPKIEKHDLSVKTKKIQEFLDEDNKVKVTIRFRGRELAHTNLGFDLCQQIMGLLREGSFVVESQPRMEGRAMSFSIKARQK